jgi:hypothetical protein
MPQLTWREAIEKVLREDPGAMRLSEIAQKIVQDGLRSNPGATPQSSVWVAAHEAIKKEGDKCPFQRIGRGLFIWKDKAGITKPPIITTDGSEEEDEVQYEIITSFGMFWRRDAIEWVFTPKILGMQELGAQPVDFYGQKGIYLLYDGREVIYVGRATEQPLGKRLYQHTVDRLSSRWDRLSWFGLLPVSEDGKLGDLPASYLGSKIIPAVEAIIIEALEPRQNRKRGDDLSNVEYMQKEDPEIQKRKAKEILRLL